MTALTEIGPGIAAAAGPEPPRRPTIVVADVHPVVRCGIRTLLGGDRYRIVAEAGALRQLVEQVGRLRPALLLLDLSLLGFPRSGGLDLLATVRALSPDTRVLILTEHYDVDAACAALAAGAHGFLGKQAAAEEIVSAVDALIAGGRYLDPALGAALFARETRGGDGLSRREREVLARIADGLTNRQIADELHLSIRTIEAQRASIKVKLGVSRRAELISCARRLRLTA
jgi:DNA-binding NarL/FixJ family response regulator